MAMTADVKDELARLEVSKACCRKAEVASMLRFAGGLHIVSGRIVVEAELDTGAAGRRLRKDIAEGTYAPGGRMPTAAIVATRVPVVRAAPRKMWCGSSARKL